MRVRGSMVPAAVALGFVWCVSSCSISSSSDSFTASSESSSASSRSSSPSGEGGSHAYRDDVRDYTARYANSAIGFDAFQKGLAEVAEMHGITNWEADRATYVAVGQGLRRAGVSAARLEDFKAAFAGSSAGDARLIQQGYDAAHG